MVILKRLLNVITILCNIYFLMLLWVMLSGGVSNWIVFVSSNFIPLVGVYLGISVINYISFGKVTIWHKNIAN